MKKSLCIALVACTFLVAFIPVTKFSDNFPSVKIGNQVWMIKNQDSPFQKSWWYENDSTTNRKYGRLYFYSSAVASAPAGWHLPSLEEWQQLIDHFDGDSLAASKMLDASSGLNLSLGGHKSANITTNDLFDLKEQFGYYWTSTAKGDQTAYAIEFRKGAPYVVKNYYRKANGFSVRYVKDKN